MQACIIERKRADTLPCSSPPPDGWHRSPTLENTSRQRTWGKSRSRLSSAALSSSVFPAPNACYWNDKLLNKSGFLRRLTPAAANWDGCCMLRSALRGFQFNLTFVPGTHSELVSARPHTAVCLCHCEASDAESCGTLTLSSSKTSAISSLLLSKSLSEFSLPSILFFYYKLIFCCTLDTWLLRQCADLREQPDFAAGISLLPARSAGNHWAERSHERQGEGEECVLLVLLLTVFRR